MADPQAEPVFRLHLALELKELYMDVPVSTASPLCLYPVKYLRFWGYCILGIDGTITTEHFEGAEIPEADLLDAGVYYFVREGELEGDALEHSVDPEAMTYSQHPG
ncbi:hypothetical protein C8R44DRAFT_863895 [Mycena epipterygia]|nr:hypothetical protein C8R44DRAFT_863895 [Mycena epipterygia]